MVCRVHDVFDSLINKDLICLLISLDESHRVVVVQGVDRIVVNNFLCIVNFFSCYDTFVVGVLGSLYCVYFSIGRYSNHTLYQETSYDESVTKKVIYCRVVFKSNIVPYCYF